MFIKNEQAANKWRAIKPLFLITFMQNLSPVIKDL